MIIIPDMASSGTNVVWTNVVWTNVVMTVGICAKCLQEANFKVGSKTVQ